jgi:hypothetical protein
MPRKAYGMDVEVNGGKGRRMISPHQSGCEATSSHGRLDVSGLGHARHNSDRDVGLWEKVLTPHCTDGNFELAVAKAS